MSIKKRFMICLLLLASYLCISYVFTNTMIKMVRVTKELEPYMILAQQLFMTLVLLIFVILLRKTEIFTYQKKTFIPSLFVGAFLFIYTILIIVLKGLSYGFPGILFTIRMFLIGFTEEVLFRGIFGEILIDERNLLKTVLLTSLLFGMAHFNNLLSGGKLYGVLIQVIGTFAIGFYFTAIWVRTHNIYVVILLHSLNDYAVLMDDSSTKTQTIVNTINSYSLMNLLPLILYVSLGVFLLRREVKPRY